MMQNTSSDSVRPPMDDLLDADDNTIAPADERKNVEVFVEATYRRYTWILKLLQNASQVKSDWHEAVYTPGRSRIKGTKIAYPSRPHPGLQFKRMLF